MTLLFEGLRSKIRFLRSLSEAAAEGGSEAMAERIFANAYMVQGVGSKIVFFCMANFSANDLSI